MLTFEKFSGINNVALPERLSDSELAVAANVDIDRSGALRRRGGYSLVADGCHKNLWQAAGFMLSTRDGGELVSISSAGVTVLHPSIGVARMWYCDLPDGRVAFSNGYICGITDGTEMQEWGVPVPESVGTLTPVAGALFPGGYRYQLTYVRLTDGLEGGPAYSGEAISVLDGGILLTGLPELAGHKINVYLTGADGDSAFFAGSANGNVFSYLGANHALALPCGTEHISPAPVGTVSAFFRGRVLVAQGSVLYASLPHQCEMFDLRRDFKQFGSAITMIQPVDDGVYVGTESELAFLSGVEFDKLTYTQALDVPVALGSGVAVRGELVRFGEGVGNGSAALCIAGGSIVACFGGARVSLMTEGVYKTAETEFSAVARIVHGGLTYVAVAQ